MMNYFSLLVLVVTWSISYYLIREGRKGKALHMKAIPIYEWVKTAIGRATEMGKPVMVTTGHSGGGINTRNAGAHVAGLSMLSFIAEECAKLDTKVIFVPGTAEMVPMGDNILREAYIKAGKKDHYQTDQVRYFSDFVHAYNVGLVTVARQEETAANFFFGAFWASDVLIGAGPGAVMGSIQIGGAVAISGTTCLVALMDHTLIGEEVILAGALVSKNVPNLNSIISGDYIKYSLIAIMLVGTILSSIGIDLSWLIS